MFFWADIKVYIILTFQLSLLFVSVAFSWTSQLNQAGSGLHLSSRPSLYCCRGNSDRKDMTLVNMDEKLILALFSYEELCNARSPHHSNSNCDSKPLLVMDFFSKAFLEWPLLAQWVLVWSALEEKESFSSKCLLSWAQVIEAHKQSFVSKLTDVQPRRSFVPCPWEALIGFY